MLQSFCVLPYVPRARGTKSNLWSASDTGQCHQGLLKFPVSLPTFLWHVQPDGTVYCLLPHCELLSFCTFVCDVLITGKAFPLFLANLCSSFKAHLKHHCHQEACLIFPSWARACGWTPTSLYNAFSYKTLVTLHDNCLSTCLLSPPDCSFIKGRESQGGRTPFEGSPVLFHAFHVNSSNPCLKTARAPSPWKSSLVTSEHHQLPCGLAHLALPPRRQLPGSKA